MSSHLENFKPKLRPGRVIPQGSRIVFETDDPYNQVVLPMVLADLVLLCSGRFSVREIVAKIYKKQGAVPFKQILKAIHVLHQGGFFENADELVLTSDLHSWMEPKKSRWSFSWRIAQRIIWKSRSPNGYYLVTLGVLIGSIFGLQYFPSSPIILAEVWGVDHGLWVSLLTMIVASSTLLSLKYIVRAMQLLILTGKAYNVSLRASVGGLHLHVGNEANDLFENRLFTAMFFVSQIVVPWLFIGLVANVLPAGIIEPVITAGIVISFWELNPFVNSDGLKLIQSLMLPSDRDVASWHFESSQLINSINPSQRQQDQDFARVCAIWGAVWIVAMFSLLHQTAIMYGPSILSHIGRPPAESVPSIVGLVVWLVCLYFVVQSFVETVLVSLVRPYWRRLRLHLAKYAKASRADWGFDKVTAKIEQLPLFSHFHEQYLRSIVDQSQVLEFGRGATIIRQGDPAREIFVLLGGEVEIVRQSRGSQQEWITELGPVSVFGETALVDEQARQAHVVAKTPVTVLLVPIRVLRTVAEQAQSIRALDDFRIAILVNQFFASSPVFRSLSPESIDFLQSRGTLEYHDQNRPVFLQGDSGDSLYLILRGTVNVQIKDRIVKRLYQGSFFGEIALIANIPRTATIATVEPCVFFKISSDAFWEVLVQHMDLGVFLETVSEFRLREDMELEELKSTGSDS